MSRTSSAWNGGHPFSGPAGGFLRLWCYTLTRTAFIAFSGAAVGVLATTGRGMAASACSTAILPVSGDTPNHPAPMAVPAIRWRAAWATASASRPSQASV